MVGLNKFPDKRKREQRRRNYIAKDKAKRRFRQQRRQAPDELGPPYEELE